MEGGGRSRSTELEIETGREEEGVENCGEETSLVRWGGRAEESGVSES